MRAWPTAVCVLAAVLFASASGHGVGLEVLDPVPLGDREVSLEVSSSQSGNPDSADREIIFSLFDTKTGVAVRDVTYEITGYKGDLELFSGTFRAPDGIFVFVLQAGDTEEIVMEEVDRAGPLSLLGFSEEVVYMSGRPLSTGGLYEFDVNIATAESFSNVPDPSIMYDVGLSIPQRTTHGIDDPNFGAVSLDIITYYDEIRDFRYDSEVGEITFHMPFEWSAENIGETAAVHEEMIFPKSFGDLLFARYAATVNGLDVPERAITVDGFAGEYTVLHVVLSQNILSDLMEARDGMDGMNFVLKAEEGSPFGTITRNGQYAVTLYWEPGKIRSGQDTTFYFEITDVFLRNTPVAVGYDVSLAVDGRTVYSGSGTSSDLREVPNRFVASIPEGSSGPADVLFDNLDGNGFAEATIPVVIDRVRGVSIPDWVRFNAGLWAQGEIDDETFAAGIGYLIEQGVVRVPAGDAGGDGATAIPDWVRFNAGLWAQGEIDDETFANGIAFLIGLGVISIQT